MQQQQAPRGGNRADRQERLLLPAGAEDRHDLRVPQVQGLSRLLAAVLRVQEALRPPRRARGGHPAA